MFGPCLYERDFRVTDGACQAVLALVSQYV